MGRQETALRRLPVVVHLWSPKNLALLVVLSRECMQLEACSRSLASKSREEAQILQDSHTPRKVSGISLLSGPNYRTIQKMALIFVFR